MIHAPGFLSVFCIRLRCGARTMIVLIVALIILCVFNPAQAEEIADKDASVKKMKRIVLALLVYENSHKHFPAAVVMGPDGKTPHSWRLELLPFLDAKGIFDRYKMDETWDSDHNLALAKEAADLFSVPSEGATDDCGYFLLTGPSTPFDGEKTTTIRKIRDGTSNTVAIVEAKRSIPWSKPEDIPFATEKPLPKLGGFFNDGFHVGFLDGSVVFLPSDFDEKTLRAMITHASREPMKKPAINVPPGLAK